MKTYIFTEKQIFNLCISLNQISVVGMMQAEQLTICKQILDAPHQVIEKEGEENEHNNNQTN